jgi:hypothetical protein
MSVNQKIIETRNWAIQFGLDYELPEWLQEAVEKGFAEDTSWHHDVSPSITFLERDENGNQIVVFVDHTNELLRETPHRFSFFYRSPHDELTEAFYCQTDSEAIEFLKKKLSKKHFSEK